MLKIDFLDISTVNTFMYSYFEIKIHADTLILFMCIYFIFPDGKLSSVQEKRSSSWGCYDAIR